VVPTVRTPLAFAEAPVRPWNEGTPAVALNNGGRALQGSADRYEAVAVTMSVRLAGSPVPTANSGRKVVPALARPSYSPTK
jgi:hypothetical protein